MQLFLPFQLLLTAEGKSVARRPLLKTPGINFQAEVCFGMCQGDISLQFCCRIAIPAVWGGSKAGQGWAVAPALCCKQLGQPSPRVCGRVLCSHFAAEPPHSDYLTSRGGKRSEKKASLTCHCWVLAAVCYPIVTNNLCDFVSNVFLASFKHNDWGVTFSSQLCKYGMFSWLSGAILHLARGPCP